MALKVPDSLSVEERITVLDRLACGAECDPYVRAFWLASLVGAGQDERLRVEALLRAVQGLGYVAEPDGEEWFLHAREVLAHGGSCHDLAVLLVALLRLEGRVSRIAWLLQPASALDHVSAQVLHDGTWLWCEPSLPGAQVGEHPYEAAQRLRGSSIVFGESNND